MRCPCRKRSETVVYAMCCGPLHDGSGAAPTAEALMRSRYAAFALRKTDYLLATWHSSTRPARLDVTSGQEWLLLRVLAHETDGNHATVAFSARSRVGGASHVLEETSRFVREGGRWFYVDGTVTSG